MSETAEPHGTVGQASESEDDRDLVLIEQTEAELVLPVWEPTGDPAVDSALDLLADLDPDRVDSHGAVFAEVHQRLRSVLTDLDATS